LHKGTQLAPGGGITLVTVEFRISSR